MARRFAWIIMFRHKHGPCLIFMESIVCMESIDLLLLLRYICEVMPLIYYVSYYNSAVSKTCLHMIHAAISMITLYATCQRNMCV